MPKVRSGERLREYRQSYDYREEYFKKNPGLFGCIWFCSQCYRPLIGRKNVVVDHIIPLSKGGRNHVSNCTAICGKCNREKSDKVDGRIVKGKVFKVFESTLFRGQRGATAVVGLGAGLIAGLGHGVLSSVKKAGKGILKLAGLGIKKTASFISYPIRKGNMVTKLAFVALYTSIVCYLLANFTPVFTLLLK